LNFPWIISFATHHVAAMMSPGKLWNRWTSRAAWAGKWSQPWQPWCHHGSKD
jgi:hypothetical protein